MPSLKEIRCCVSWEEQQIMHLGSASKECLRSHIIVAIICDLTDFLLKPVVHILIFSTRSVKCVGCFSPARRSVRTLRAVWRKNDFRLGRGVFCTRLSLRRPRLRFVRNTSSSLKQLIFSPSQRTICSEKRIRSYLLMTYLYVSCDFRLYLITVIGLKLMRHRYGDFHGDFMIFLPQFVI